MNPRPAAELLMSCPARDSPGGPAGAKSRQGGPL